jgi:hypothetical protein
MTALQNVVSLTRLQIEEIGPFAWPGAYINMFADEDNSILCYECALVDADDELHVFGPVRYIGYLEGQDTDDPESIEYCENCGKPMDPALRND